MTSSRVLQTTGSSSECGRGAALRAAGCGSGQRPNSNAAHGKFQQDGVGWDGMRWDNEGAGVSMPPQALSTPAFMTTLGLNSGSRSQRRLPSFEDLSGALGKCHPLLCSCGWPSVCVCRCRAPTGVSCSYVGNDPSYGCHTSLQQGLRVVTSALLVTPTQAFPTSLLDSKTVASDMQPCLAREAVLGACQ
jgi:hypothetical protein